MKKISVLLLLITVLVQQISYIKCNSVPAKVDTQNISQNPNNKQTNRALVSNSMEQQNSNIAIQSQSQSTQSQSSVLPAFDNFRKLHLLSYPTRILNYVQSVSSYMWYLIKKIISLPFNLFRSSRQQIVPVSRVQYLQPMANHLNHQQYW